MPEHHPRGFSARDIPYAIRTDNALKKQLGDVDMKKIFTADKLKECQELFDAANENFKKDAVEQVAVLEDLHRQCLKNPSQSLPQLKKIAVLSHQLRGRMEALGYLFCYEICTSLHGFSNPITSPSAAHLTVVDKHLKALHVALHENMAGDGGAIGKEMVMMLGQLIQKLA